MSKKQRPVVIKQGLDGWVMTYGDMMSLLLTFFVLIVSFSSMQEAKFKDAAESLRRAFGVMNNPQSVIEFNDPLVPKYETEESKNLLDELKAVEMALLEANAGKSVELQYTSDGVRFRIDAPVLFAAGATDINPGSHRILDILAGFLGRIPGDIRVEGHSDATPISTARFPSNWELSAARAGAVARYFQGKGLPPERIAATGYGEFHPLADNATAEGRAKNRRVEIFLRVQKKQPPAGARPVSEALDGNGGSAPRPTPVTDRLRSLQQDP
ncbi:MAG: OmpA family protein [Candidatus Krumholzibacteriia bacterium]